MGKSSGSQLFVAGALQLFWLLLQQMYTRMIRQGEEASPFAKHAVVVVGRRGTSLNSMFSFSPG